MRFPILVSGAVVVGVAILVGIRYELFAASRVQPPNRTYSAYRIDGERKLVLGNGQAFVVKPKAKEVILLSSRRHWRLGSVLLWPRREFSGVYFGDGVKLSEAYRAEFHSDGSVRISFPLDGRQEAIDLPLN